MLQIYSNFIEITPWHGCSPVNLLHIFRTLFPKDNSGGLLLLKWVFPLPGSAINISIQSLSSKLKIGRIHRRCLRKKKTTCIGVSFLIKLEALRLQFYYKCRLQQNCFSVNFAKILKTLFLQITFGRQLFNEISDQ